MAPKRGREMERQMAFSFVVPGLGGDEKTARVPAEPETGGRERPLVLREGGHFEKGDGCGGEATRQWVRGGGED